MDHLDPLGIYADRLLQEIFDKLADSDELGAALEEPATHESPIDGFNIADREDASIRLGNGVGSNDLHAGRVQRPEVLERMVDIGPQGSQESRQHSLVPDYLGDGRMWRHGHDLAIEPTRDFLGRRFEQNELMRRISPQKTRDNVVNV
jgi:hypothetical protein